LLSDVDARTCWQLAEQAGDASPHGMQRLLGEAVWDADAVRDDARLYVVDELGDATAVLILDDTGDLKKGTHSVGVQRHYTGTAGRIKDVSIFVELESGGPPPRACRVVGVGQPPSRTDEEGDRREQHLPEREGRCEPRGRAG
jgi:DDE superfamily endonuclease